MAGHDTFNFKRIADPVHGTIGLSRLEAAVIDTAPFQRLHEIKQLGLAYLVYPGANYSRFAHCVGACHIAGRLIGAINDRKREYGTLTDEDHRDVQLYRLAGLLHDIGHYPFSHAFEVAIEEHYAKQKKAGGTPIALPGIDVVAPLDTIKHEVVGARLLEHDEELRSAIEQFGGGVGPDDVAPLFSAKSFGRYPTIISSDLDADRLDYLQRTSIATGLPYGSVDLDYIVRQTCLDKDNKVCLTDKAMRAADQMLLSRFFDFRQVAFHKATASFEWMLGIAVGALLEADSDLDFTESGIIDRIKLNSWRLLTDSFIRERLIEHVSSVADPVKRAFVDAILARRPAKLIAEVERFTPRGNGESERSDHANLVALAMRCIPSWAKEFSLDERLWKVWHKNIRITEVGSTIRQTAARAISEKDEQKFGNTVLLVERHGAPSKSLSEASAAITSIMSNQMFEAIRVYVLLDGKEEALRTKIAAAIQRDIPDAGWVRLG